MRRFAPRFQSRLHLVKKLLADNRLVVAFVQFAAIPKISVVKGIGKYVRNLVALHRFAAIALPSLRCFGFYAVFGKEVGRVL